MALDGGAENMNAYLLSLDQDSNVADQWDFGFIKDFLTSNNLVIREVDKLPKIDKAIVCIPARHHAGLEQQIDVELNKIGHVVLFLLGDEEAAFDIDVIKHNSIHIWVQNPHMGKHDAYNRIGTGYPQHMKANLPSECVKTTDIYFSGQVTHRRRLELMEVLLAMKSKAKYSVTFNSTKGFTQGDKPKTYYAKMMSARIAPAPSGAVIPDSFRLFEALECMCVVVADQKTPDDKVMEYWDWLFKDITPFPKVNDWNVLKVIAGEVLKDYPRNLHHQTVWWIKYKRDFAIKVMGQLNG